MDKEILIETVKLLQPGSVVNKGKQFVEVTVSPDDLHNLAQQLKNNPELAFDFLFCLSGVDYGNELGIVYHLRSTTLHHSIVLNSRISDRNNPEIDSVADLWETAEYHEREVYDLLGIKFRNHPDLRRFFLPSSAGYPLRKDFVDDENVVMKK